MTGSPALVVGAGAAGLGAAIALAAHGPVTVFDRHPAPGGPAGHDRAEVQAAVTAAERAGVVLVLGATATRWGDRQLLVCAPGEIRSHAGALLVFAGGERPATAAELGLAGERPAGVLPVTVAGHLLATQRPPWHRVVILGNGAGAAEAAALVERGGGSVVVLEHAPRGAEVLGRERVTGLRIGARVLPCDALLLAADPRPVRNVEGAIADGARDVVYVQRLRADGFAATVRLAGTAVSPGDAA